MARPWQEDVPDWKRRANPLLRAVGATPAPKVGRLTPATPAPKAEQLPPATPSPKVGRLTPATPSPKVGRLTPATPSPNVGQLPLATPTPKPGGISPKHAPKRRGAPPASLDERAPAGKRPRVHEDQACRFGDDVSIDQGSSQGEELGPGYLFLCSNATQPECEALMVFGAPEDELGQMKRCIKVGTKLFLFNFETRVLMGPFTASSTPGRSLAPEAFKGRFSAQVRIKMPQEAVRDAKLEKRPASGAKSADEMCALFKKLLSSQASSPAGDADDIDDPMTAEEDEEEEELLVATCEDDAEDQLEIPDWKRKTLHAGSAVAPKVSAPALSTLKGVSSRLQPKESGFHAEAEVQHVPKPSSAIVRAASHAKQNIWPKPKETSAAVEVYQPPWPKHQQGSVRAEAKAWQASRSEESGACAEGKARQLPKPKETSVRAEFTAQENPKPTETSVPAEFKAQQNPRPTETIVRAEITAHENPKPKASGPRAEIQAQQAPKVIQAANEMDFEVSGKSATMAMWTESATEKPSTWEEAGEIWQKQSDSPNEFESEVVTRSMSSKLESETSAAWPERDEWWKERSGPKEADYAQQEVQNEDVRLTSPQPAPAADPTAFPPSPPCKADASAARSLSHANVGPWDAHPGISKAGQTTQSSMQLGPTPTPPPPSSATAGNAVEFEPSVPSGESIRPPATRPSVDMPVQATHVSPKLTPAAPPSPPAPASATETRAAAAHNEWIRQATFPSGGMSVQATHVSPKITPATPPSPTTPANAMETRAAVAHNEWVRQATFPSVGMSVRATQASPKLAPTPPPSSPISAKAMEGGSPAPSGTWNWPASDPSGTMWLQRTADPVPPLDAKPAYAAVPMSVPKSSALLPSAPTPQGASLEWTSSGLPRSGVGGSVGPGASSWLMQSSGSGSGGTIGVGTPGPFGIANTWSGYGTASWNQYGTAASSIASPSPCTGGVLGPSSAAVWHSAGSAWPAWSFASTGPSHHKAWEQSFAPIGSIAGPQTADTDATPPVAQEPTTSRGSFSAASSSAVAQGSPTPPVEAAGSASLPQNILDMIEAKKREIALLKELQSVADAHEHEQQTQLEKKTQSAHEHEQQKQLEKKTQPAHEPEQQKQLEKKTRPAHEPEQQKQLEKKTQPKPSTVSAPQPAVATGATQSISSSRGARLVTAPPAPRGVISAAPVKRSAVPAAAPSKQQASVQPVRQEDWRNMNVHDLQRHLLAETSSPEVQPGARKVVRL